MTPAQTADWIIALYHRHGNADYIGEPVSQLEHMCQCAQLAEDSGADDEMILAAFFHDIGHLYEHYTQKDALYMDGYGTVDHEKLGADFVHKSGFTERIAKLVGSHVDAKRYLTATDAAYYGKLSEASKETLRMQGGPMTPTEIETFEADPLHKEYIQLRLWDEQAKETEVPIPDLKKYHQIIIDQLTKNSHATN